MAHRLKGGTTYNHLQKTGGSWVMSALKRGGCYHCVWGEGFWKSHSVLWSPQTFTFVRHPYEWIRSWHAYRESRGVSARDNAPFRLNAPCPDLNGTVRWLYENDRWMIQNEYGRYTTPPEGSVCYVGRTECLADHLVEILRICGEEFDEERLRSVPRVNVSPHYGDLSEESRCMIDDMSGPILERFYNRSDGPNAISRIMPEERGRFS